MSISPINSPEHQKHADGLADALAMKATVEHFDPNPRIRRHAAIADAVKFEVETGAGLDKIAEGIGLWPLRETGETCESLRNRIRALLYPEMWNSEGGTCD